MVTILRMTLIAPLRARSLVAKRQKGHLDQVVSAALERSVDEVVPKIDIDINRLELFVVFEFHPLQNPTGVGGRHVAIQLDIVFRKQIGVVARLRIH
jgi:hypothetical protein